MCSSDLFVSDSKSETKPETQTKLQESFATRDKEEKYTSRESSIPPMQWHINKLTTTKPLPEVGEVCLVQLDKDGLYFVDR